MRTGGWCVIARVCVSVCSCVWLCAWMILYFLVGERVCGCVLMRKRLRMCVFVAARMCVSACRGLHACVGCVLVYSSASISHVSTSISGNMSLYLCVAVCVALVGVCDRVWAPAHVWRYVWRMLTVCDFLYVICWKCVRKGVCAASYLCAVVCECVYICVRVWAGVFGPICVSLCV